MRRCGQLSPRHINSEPKRYEYQHPAYQLVLADGGNGAIGGRGRAVFGTCLATGEQARGERDVYKRQGNAKRKYLMTDSSGTHQVYCVESGIDFNTCLLYTSRCV